MENLSRSFDWLVEHEKVLILTTSILIIALGLQLRFCQRNVASDVTVSQTLTNSNASINGRLTGIWAMSVEKKKGGVQNWILTLSQDGDKLSGVISSEGGDLPVNGMIKGDEVSLSAKKFGVTVEFPARVEGETMTGTMKALMIRRQWTARRK